MNLFSKGAKKLSFLPHPEDAGSVSGNIPMGALRLFWGL